MSTFRIRILNKDFESCSDASATNPETARSEALRSALRIGTDEVCDGNPFFAAQVTIENEHEQLERLVIAIGASSLQADNGSTRGAI